MIEQQQQQTVYSEVCPGTITPQDLGEREITRRVRAQRQEKNVMFRDSGEKNLPDFKWPKVTLSLSSVIKLLLEGFALRVSL